jgi:hypothetical protein
MQIRFVGGVAVTITYKLQHRSIEGSAYVNAYMQDCARSEH